MVPKIAALRDSNPAFAGKIVYIPFNEPDGIWYRNINSDENVKNKFNSDWKAAYELIKSLDPDALIGGVSFATYQHDAMDRWLRFCKDNGCEPDCITWHELQTDKLTSFADHLGHYRWVEKSVGMEPREIIINEYAPQDHCSVPGKLVNWIALFEENKVSGCLPYWHNAGNLNDIAADNNEPNGAWWLYKWYGDMSGETLKLSTSTARDQLYGLASLDENKKAANVIFGGVDGEADIVLENIADTKSFAGAEAVDVKIEATYWTAFHGVADEPTVVQTGTYAVNDGKVTVTLSGMEATAAYNITVTAASDASKAGVVYRGPWRKTYEAEDGRLHGSAAADKGRWTYAKSGGCKVSGIVASDDGVDIEVNVPQSGYYRADLVYGNEFGLNTKEPEKNATASVSQIRTVDGGEGERLVLESTLRAEMTGMYSDYIYLEKGDHLIAYRGSGETAKGADLDCLSLSYVGGEEPVFNSIYEAELGDFNTLAGNGTTSLTVERELDGFSGSGYVTGLGEVSVKKGGGVRFTVVVPEGGLYDLTLRCAADGDSFANIYLDNTALTLDNFLTDVEIPASETFADSGVTVYLQKGINIIDIDGDGGLAFDYLRVSKAAGASAATVTVEAENGELNGAEIKQAADEVYVAGIEGGTAGFDSVAEGFAVTGFADGTLSYESTEPAQLIYADYGEKVNVKRVPLEVGSGEVTLEEHDKTFVWLAGEQTLMRPAVKHRDDDSLTVGVTVPEAGAYKMEIRFSNGELFGAHDYNAQLVDRYASYSVNGGEEERLYFKNTFSDENWRTVTVPVTLNAGENTVKIRNDNWRTMRCGVLKEGTTAHLPENIEYQTLVNVAPNLDSFSFTPAVLGASAAAARYKVSVMTAGRGYAGISAGTVPAGGSVTLTLEPELLGGNVTVTANGKDVSSLVEGGELTMKADGNIEFRVIFGSSENDDPSLVNNSFGTGDLTGWNTDGAVSVETDGESHYALLGDGAALSQTLAGAEAGYYTLEFTASGKGSVSLVGPEGEACASAEIDGDRQTFSVKALASKDGALKVTAAAEGGELAVDGFRIAGFDPVDTSLLYFVDCGDPDTSTLSSGDAFGLYNSSTEQFFAADPVTGREWGIDDEYVKNDKYPDLLTGALTWPCENNSAVHDGVSKAMTFRYAKDQKDHVDPGVTYKFELEDGMYYFEVGFYCSWGASPNRKSALSVNGSVIAGGIIPSTDAAAPVIIREQANVTGGYASLNLNLESDGAGGPMMSYIKISASKYKKVDTSGMKVTGSATWNNQSSTTADKAFDGKLSTYFDGVEGGWAQIDFGREIDIAAIGYVPRNEWADRMAATNFLVSDDGQTWTELYTVGNIPPYGKETVVSAADFRTDKTAWRYLKYQNPNDYCNVAEIYIYE